MARGFFSFLFFVLCAAPSLAAAPSKEQLVAQIEKYLNSLTTLEAHFDQIVSTGSQASGKFYLDRTRNRFRLEYDPPVPVLMIAMDGHLVYIDNELQQASHIDLKETPASIFLQKPVKLSTLDASPQLILADNILEVSLEMDDRIGQVSLTFQKKPFEFLGWSVVDAQGVVTNVFLGEMKKGVTLPDFLFEYINPKFFKVLKPQQ